MYCYNSKNAGYPYYTGAHFDPSLLVLYFLSIQKNSISHSSSCRLIEKKTYASC